MQVTIDVPDNLPQAFIHREIKQFEEKLKKQAENDIAGCFSQYAKTYIPTSQAVNQAWEKVTTINRTQERKSGILPGSLSNSFFEPLPEEELRAWE